MHKLAESKLIAGFIYGDPATEEYVYLPGSEVGTDNPVLIYECEKKRQDISIENALELIEKRSLRLTSHPIFGKRTL